MATDIQQVTLSPADIPGADLSEPFNRHTVPDLRWWLLHLESASNKPGC